VPPASTGGEPGPQGDVGDAGKRALAELRRDLRTKDTALQEATARIAELEAGQRSETENLRADNERLKGELGDREQRLGRLELDAQRRSAAAAAGIPEWWERLQGSTPEELETDAKQLAERLHPQRPPTDLGQGARPGAQPTGMTELIRRKGIEKR
jgi:hypothetical protein